MIVDLASALAAWSQATASRLTQIGSPELVLDLISCTSFMSAVGVRVRGTLELLDRDNDLLRRCVPRGPVPLQIDGHQARKPFSARVGNSGRDDASRVSYSAGFASTMTGTTPCLSTPICLAAVL